MSQFNRLLFPFYFIKIILKVKSKVFIQVDFVGNGLII